MNATTTGIEGSLKIRLAPARGTVYIHSSRPLLASQLFEGKHVDEVLPLVPLLFSLCGQAQQTAAVRAIEAASSKPATAFTEQARDHLVDLETLREHLLRILMDWPRFCGEAFDGASLPELTSSIEQIRRTIDPDRMLCTAAAQATVAGEMPSAQQFESLHALVRNEILEIEPVDWLQCNEEGLQHWLSTSDGIAGRLLRRIWHLGWQQLGAPSTDFLKPLPAKSLTEKLDGDEAEAFIAAPTWQAKSLETGPMARQSGHPLLKALHVLVPGNLLARLVARLIEVAMLVTRQPIAWAARDDNDQAPGLAQVEAARGRLCHRVVLDGDVITRYRILAPTEWNFGPNGVAARALKSIKTIDPQVIRAQADLLVHAVDPCVGYNLEVETG